MRIRLILAVLAASTACFGQGGGLRHFVSPPYPQLARQTGTAGRVSLVLDINAAGDVKVTSVQGGESVPYPWLAASAKETVESWKYETGPDKRRAQAVIYYSLSGETRDCYPKTKVTTDFDGPNIRIFVITDAPLFSQPEGSEKHSGTSK